MRNVAVWQCEIISQDLPAQTLHSSQRNYERQGKNPEKNQINQFPIKKHVALNLLSPMLEMEHVMQITQGNTLPKHMPLSKAIRKGRRIRISGFHCLQNLTRFEVYKMP